MKAASWCDTLWQRFERSGAPRSSAIWRSCTYWCSTIGIPTSSIVHRAFLTKPVPFMLVLTLSSTDLYFFLCSILLQILSNREGPFFSAGLLLPFRNGAPVVDCNRLLAACVVIISKKENSSQGYCSLSCSVTAYSMKLYNALIHPNDCTVLRSTGILLQYVSRIFLLSMNHLTLFPASVVLDWILFTAT